MDANELEQLERSLRGQPLRRPSAKLDDRLGAVFNESPSARPDEHAMKTGTGTATPSGSDRKLMQVVAEPVPVFISQPSAPVRRIPGRLATWIAAIAATAAAVLVILNVRPVGEDVQRRAVGFEPDVRIEQVWTKVTRSAVAAPGDGPAMQWTERQVVRHVRWIDQQNSAEIEWNIPSEQFVLAPLEYN